MVELSLKLGIQTFDGNSFLSNTKRYAFLKTLVKRTSYNVKVLRSTFPLVAAYWNEQSAI